MAPRRCYPKTTGPMDQWLEGQGYYRKHTARDGSCLFRAVSEQVYYTQAFHQNVRRECVEFIQKNKNVFQEMLEEPLEDYATRMLGSREWGGQLEISAMSLLYNCDVLVFEDIGKPPHAAASHGFEKKILLCFSSDNHYDSVYPKLYIVQAAFCQSLAYEVLYKNVFQIPDVNYAVNKMLHDKTNRVQKERILNEELISCGRFGFSMEISMETSKDYKDEEIVNVKELLAHGATPFPYKVAKALDPNIYRNIEFDIWNDYRREIKFGWFRNNGELQVGVKCLVKLNSDRNFHAHIQEMSPDKGPVIVFVEELGEKCTVPYDNLEPLPKSDKPQWPVPYKHCRQLPSIQQKSAVLAFTEFGGKWKRSKVGKSRKLKENNVHTPLSPRLQYNSKMNPGVPKYSNQHNPRFLREQIGNQQVQLTFQNYSTENFNNLQNYSNVGVDMPPMPVSLMLDQPTSTTSPVMTQAMIMSMTAPVTTASNHTTNTVKPGDPINSSSEQCLQQPDSTTEVPGSQQTMMTHSSSLPVEHSLCSPSQSLSQTQLISFASYSSPPTLAPQITVPTSGPRPESSPASPGIMNPSSCYSDTTCTKSTTSPYMICNTAVNVGVVGVSGGSDQPRDFNANLLFQPVNFLAQKSLQISGNDLPLSDIPTLRFYYNLGHDYFRLSYMYWPSMVQEKQTNSPSTTTLNYGENPNFGCPVTTSNNAVPANEHPLPDSTSSLQEDLYQLGHEATSNLMLSSDHNIHIATDTDKPAFHASAGENENVSWQPKQADVEVPQMFHKTFNNGITSRINKNSSEGRDNRIHTSHLVRPHQNPTRHGESYDVHTTAEQSEDIESNCGHAVSDTHASSPAVLTTNYNVPPPAVPYTYTPVPPAVYNHTVVPFCYPVEAEQGMMPVPYYPQYAVSSPVPLVSQDTTETPAAVPDGQNVPTHFTGSVYSQLPQPATVDSGFVPPYAMYPQPPTPLMYQQSSSVPAAVYPPGTGPVTNISAPRWMQTNQGAVHIMPTPCVYQSPQATHTGSAVPYNTPT
ncbi:deubiquitinase otu-like [Periplaneta americana]|uniref:deubiquitinase otu-like n=1 Tax=Periplaneta americana TaxID=6978 RepID=UPI0037E99BD5